MSLLPNKLFTLRPLFIFLLLQLPSASGYERHIGGRWRDEKGQREREGGRNVCVQNSQREKSALRSPPLRLAAGTLAAGWASLSPWKSLVPVFTVVSKDGFPGRRDDQLSDAARRSGWLPHRGGCVFDAFTVIVNHVERGSFRIKINAFGEFQFSKVQSKQ